MKKLSYFVMAPAKNEKVSDALEKEREAQEKKIAKLESELEKNIADSNATTTKRRGPPPGRKDSKKRKPSHAPSTTEYKTIAHQLLSREFHLPATANGCDALTTDGLATVKVYKLRVVDELLVAAESISTPKECEEDGCKSPGIYRSNTNEKARRCESHKKEKDMVVGCSKCRSSSAAVTVNGVIVCLAHAVLEVQGLENPTIVGLCGTLNCACGVQSAFGLKEKKPLVCKDCGIIWGLLLGKTFKRAWSQQLGQEDTRMCVGALCANKKTHGSFIGNNKRYCSRDRKAMIDAEKADPTISFDQRTSFKYAPSPCEGKMCTAEGCTEESVTKRADEALCLTHWKALKDDDEKKAFEWTGTCYAQAVHGPKIQDGDVRGPCERCGKHAKPGDVNNFSSRCTVCVAINGWASAKLAKDGKCADCAGSIDSHWFPQMRQSILLDFWQREKAAALTVTYEWRPNVLVEDKKWRIDAKVDRPDGTVDLIEVDEDAHKWVNECEELKRLHAVVQIPEVNRVVRVNPDRPRKKIADKITRGRVKAGGWTRKLTLDDKLGFEEVKPDNLNRSVGLVEDARAVEPGHVVYIDYPEIAAPGGRWRLARRPPRRGDAWCVRWIRQHDHRAVRFVLSQSKKMNE